MKKGMFFTLIAITLISSLVVTFSVVAQYRYYNKMRVVETRAGVMNAFVDSVQRDMSRALYIAGFRALVSIDNYIVSNNTYFHDINDAFREAILNGSLNGNPQVLLANQTLIYWQQKIISKAADSGLILSIDVKDIEIKHISPWVIQFSASMDFILTDTFVTASWNMTERTISSNLSIIGFEDPIYATYTGNRISRRITKTDITNWTTSSLLSHLESHNYTENPSAPTFLMRLANNLSADPMGIESLVDTSELAIYGITVKENTTAVDYLYWKNSNVSVYGIYGITDDDHPFFRLDINHTTFYGVQNETYI